ncbi:MAG: hypothetical protein E7050_03390 [Lentisphaerae bacterium]|nr:hypothetical protein [Lentisphaerota bacterium]
MSEMNLPPLSMRLENRVGMRRGILLLCVLFLLLTLPWILSQCELFRQEGVFAAVASGYADSRWNPALGFAAQAHDMPLSDVFPLYPFLVSLLYRCNVPMEMALRIISTFMLGVLALLSGIAAGSRINKRAGIVAACCCFGTLFALGKGVFGGAEVMAACFLLAAQLLFFHYGSRLADWNSAWISSAIFLTLGFLTRGPVVILFFIFPLFFLRRPLSFTGKFRTPGFLIGIAFLVLIILFWALPLGISLRNYSDATDMGLLSSAVYWRDVLFFLVQFPLRMLPWSLIMWMPFCVALQAISPVPVFSRYLRTLFFANLALVWLLPGASSSLIFFLIGPLSILTGLTYDLGVRRYGAWIRKALIAGGLFFPVIMLVIIVLTFIPVRFLHLFGDPEKMMYREVFPGYIYLALGALLMLMLLGFIYSFGRCRFPVWVQLVLICFGIGVFYTAEILPYQMMNSNWRKLGNDIQKALPENVSCLYKYEIDGLYSGLFYTKCPVRKLQSLEDLENLGDTVYVISSQLPVDPGWVWTPLLPDDYRYGGVNVSLWRGVRRVEDENWEESNE